MKHKLFSLSYIGKSLYSKNTLPFLAVVYLLLNSVLLTAQCPAGSTEVTVSYTAGAFDNENSWVLWDATNNVSLACYEESQTGANTQSACVPNGAQIELITYESFGDGWNESTISVTVSEDGSGGSTCNNIASLEIFSNLVPTNGFGSPQNPGSIPQGRIASCPPTSIPTDIACQNTFSIDNTCTISGSTSSIVGPTGSLCVDEQFIFTGGNAGSIWSGPFISDNGDGTAIFNAFFPGLYTIFLTDGSGCLATTIVTVEGVNPFVEGQMQLCLSSNPVTLNPADPNVSWSGTGVINNADGTGIFDPNIAGIGNHTVTFTYSNAVNGCNYTRDFDFQVNAGTPPDPNTYGPLCASDGPITLMGNPLNANSFWFGPEVTDNGDGTAIFDPSNFGGNATVTIGYGINDGCISETQIEIIGGDPFVPSYSDFCEDSGDITLYANPSGGIWTGIGLIDNGDGTYNFSPSIAGIGTHTLTYTFQEPTNTCPVNVVTTEVTVITNDLDLGTYGPICGTDAPITLTGNSLNPNGVWFGHAVTNNGDGTGIFDPSMLGNGTYSVGYFLNGCSQFTEIVVEGGTPFINNFPSITQFCDSQDPIQLFGFPDGGTWSGNGLTINTDGSAIFDPAAAGIGTFTISYTVSDGSSCPPAVQTIDFTVNGGIPPDPGSYGSVCPNDDPITLIGTPNDGTGTWSGFSPGFVVVDNGDGTGTFYPNRLPLVLGSPFDIIYTHGGCSSFTTITLDGINPSIFGSTQNCVSSDPVSLGPPDPNAFWSGPGITSNTDGTAIFDPSIANIGNNAVIFNYSNPTSGCEYSIDFEFTVNDTDPPDPGTYGPLCVMDGPITLIGNPLDVNSFWFGPEVTDNGDGTATFDPSIFEGNTIVTIGYGINEGCISETQIEIIGGDPYVHSYSDVCIDDDFENILFADPPGGVWTGTGVIDNGDGTYTFSPSTAGIGTYTLTYTFQESTNACPVNVVTTDITVIENTLDPGTYGPICGADAPITLTGNPVDPNGFWNGPGVTDNGDGTGTFDPSALGTGSFYVSYFLNACSQFTEIVVEGGSPFIGYSGFSTTVCTNQEPIQLFGSPGGGTWSGIGVTATTDDSAIFDPSVAGPGTTTISYTTISTASSGCPPATNSIAFIVNNGTPPDPGSYDPVCFGDGPVTLIGSPNDGTGTWSGFELGFATIDNGDGTGTFYPDRLPIGLNSFLNVTYTHGGCSATTSIEVNGGPVSPSISPFTNMCLSDPALPLFGLPNDGTWSGPGIITTDDPEFPFFFDPAVAGTGSFTITYSNEYEGTGCTPQSESVIIEVGPLVDAGSYEYICTGAAPVTLIGSPTDANGTWTGIGVTDNGDGTATFNPSAGNIGANTATYTYTNANNCTNSNATSLTIMDCMVDLTVTDPCDCFNPANIRRSSGTLYQDVLTAGTSTGLTVVLQSNDGNLLDNTGQPIPVGTPFTESSTGVYSLNFYTVESQPATVSVSNGLSVIPFVTDSCTCDNSIPTMTQWGVSIFGLLILNLSLILLGKINRLEHEIN